jgi:hypothetical protein
MKDGIAASQEVIEATMKAIGCADFASEPSEGLYQQRVSHLKQQFIQFKALMKEPSFQTVEIARDNVKLMFPSQGKR